MYVNNNSYAIWFASGLQVRPGESFDLPEGFQPPAGCQKEANEQSKEPAKK